MARWMGIRCCRRCSIEWTNPAGSIVTGYDVYMDLGDGLELVSDNQTGTSYYTGLLDSNTEHFPDCTI